MDHLDSQALMDLDGYYHRFLTKGEYIWGVGAVGKNLIHVQAAGGTGKQVTIKLQYDSSTGYWAPDTPEVTINANDFILWYAPGTTVSYSVYGDSQPSGDRFGSSFLGPEDAFSHFFQLAGDYNYVVGGGNASPFSGTIKASKGSPTHTAVLVAVDGDKGTVNPDPVPITIGDTVHWDIGAGTKLSISTAQ